MNMIEQLQIISAQAEGEVRTVLMWVCLAVLASGLLCAILAVASSKVRKLILWLGPVGCAMVLPGALKTYCYGSNKPEPTGPRITFDGGIKQNPIQPSTVSNNLFEVHWTRDTSGGIYVPEAATVYIDYKEWANTNATWQPLAQTTVGAWGYSTMLLNATNYSYNVWAYYIPPEPVHTNGVWLYKTMKDRHQGNPIPLRARIEVNGKAIATPKEKRKDEAE